MTARFKYLLKDVKENFFAEQERWIALVPFLFSLGIGIYFALPQEPNYWLCLAAIEIVLLLFYLLRFRNLHLLFWGVLIVLAGFIDIQLQSVRQSRKVEFLPQVTQYMRGRITEISFSSKGKKRLLLENVSDFDKPLKGKYRVTLMGHEKFAINECVEFVGTIFPPSRIQIYNGFQLDRKYFYEGLSGTGYAISEVFSADCPQNMPPVTFSSSLNAVRKSIIEDIGKILSPDVAGVVDSVLIGEQTAVTETVNNNYRDSGLAHFLSVSGLHLGAIAGLAFFVLRFLLALFPYIALHFEVKKIAAVGAVLFSGVYLLISGMAIPAQRAFIMTAVVFAGIIFNRKAISLRMISFAALVILIIEPQSLVSISFQMSFAAVTALISFYESYDAKIAQWNRNKGVFGKVLIYFAGIVLCDFIASLATTPFVLYYFHRLSVYTSLGNLLGGPLIGFWLMPLILVCLVVLPFGNLSYYPLKALGFGTEILNAITAYVAKLPGSVAFIDSLSFGGFLLIVCGGYWLCIWRLKWRWWGVFPIALGIISMFFTPTEPDVVFAANGDGFAVRDKGGNMVLLPQKTDSWIQKIWKENLRLRELSKEEKSVLKEIYTGKKKLPEVLDLTCTQEKCLYKGIITLAKDGSLFNGGEKIDNAVGGYIFIKNGKVRIVPFYNKKNCRLWNICTVKVE